MNKPKRSFSDASKAIKNATSSKLRAMKGSQWDEASEEKGEGPKRRLKKPLAERSAEVEARVKKGASAGPPIVRMGRPRKSGPKVETEIVTFRTDKFDKETLETLAKAQGRSLSDLLRSATHEMVTAFKAGQEMPRPKVPGGKSK